MLIIQGMNKGRTKECILFWPVPTLTRASWSCNDLDALGWLQRKLVLEIYPLQA